MCRLSVTTLKMKCAFFGVVLQTLILCCWSLNTTDGYWEAESDDVCPNSNGSITVIPGHVHNIANFTGDDGNLYVAFKPNTSLFAVQRRNQEVGVSVNAPPNTTFHVTLTSSKCTFHRNITMGECPAGYLLKNNECVCSDSHNEPFPLMQCNSGNLSIKIMVGYCVSYDGTQLSYARCPYFSEQQIQGLYIPLTANGNSMSFCSAVDRQDKQFCRECIEEYCVSVYSDTFKCINGTHRKIWKDALSYLSIEIIPATVFFMFVLYFHIRLTSAPANGFILFSQIVTTPFEATFLQFTKRVILTTSNSDKYLATTLAEVVFVPYTFSNLEFYRTINTQKCLFRGLRIVDILALRYLSALYPLLLLLVAYIIIELQAMNVRPILWLLKVICFPCMRWRRVWKAKVSILDTFAAYVVLSYVKFMYISFLLLSSSEVEGKKYRTLTIDPSIVFLSKDHIPYIILSLVVITFGIIPPLFLLFYQLKGCMSCLVRLHLHRPGLEQFILAFQGCYKDGTNGTGDRRFFAGVYFVFRLIIVLVYTLPQNTIIILGLKTGTFIVFLFVLAVSQPYKKSVYTFIDGLFYTTLGFISALQFYIYATLEENDISRSWFQYVLLQCIPLIYMTCYLFYRLFVCFKNRDSNRYLLLNNDDDDSRETTHERVEHRRAPVTIDISPRTSITRTEVSITELSQSEDGSGSENIDRETSPLLKKREMEIFSQHAATISQEYSAY